MHRAQLERRLGLGGGLGIGVVADEERDRDAEDQAHRPMAGLVSIRQSGVTNARQESESDET